MNPFALRHGVITDEPITQGHASTIIQQAHKMYSFKEQTHYIPNETCNLSRSGWKSAACLKVEPSVVVIGACPSLDKHWPTVRAYAKDPKCTVICVDRAALPCAAHGVRPDVYFSAEPDGAVDATMQGIDTGCVPLVCPSWCSPGLVGSHGGQVYHYRGINYNSSIPLADQNPHGLPIFYEYDHVCAAAYIWAVMAGAKDVHFFGNDYYVRGYEKYSPIKGDVAFRTTQYYAKPIPDNRLRIMWRQDTVGHVALCANKPYYFLSYPKPIVKGSEKQPGKWVDGVFRWFRYLMGVAILEHPAEVFWNE